MQYNCWHLRIFRLLIHNIWSLNLSTSLPNMAWSNKWLKNTWLMPKCRILLYLNYWSTEQTHFSYLLASFVDVAIRTAPGSRRHMQLWISAGNFIDANKRCWGTKTRRGGSRNHPRLTRWGEEAFYSIQCEWKGSRECFQQEWCQQYFLPIEVPTEHWVEFPALYSRFSLVACFTHSIVYMSIPVSQFIPPSTSPLGIYMVVLYICVFLLCKLVFPGGLVGKQSAWNVGDLGSIPGSGRSLGEGNGNPLQYSWLENSTDRGAWWATVHGVTKSQTWVTTTFICTIFLDSTYKQYYRIFFFFLTYFTLYNSL